MKLVRAKFFGKPGSIFCVLVGEAGNKTIIFDSQKLTDSEKKLIGDNRKVLLELDLDAKLKWAKENIRNYTTKIKTPFTRNIIVIEEYGK